MATCTFAEGDEVAAGSVELLLLGEYTCAAVFGDRSLITVVEESGDVKCPTETPDVLKYST